MFNDLARDLNLVSRPRRRKAREDLFYWLRVIGFDPTSSTFYRFYVLIFWIVWAIAMWSYVVDQGRRVGLAVAIETRAELWALVPLLFFVAAIAVLYAMLRSNPLKLNAPEMHFIVSAPVRRGALAITHFVGSTILPALAFSLAVSVIAMIFYDGADVSGFGLAGLFAGLTAFPIAITVAAVAWAIALARMTPALNKFKVWFWLIPVAIVALGVAIPEVRLAIGRAWATAPDGSMSIFGAIGVVAAAVGSIVLLYAVGEQVHMTLIADDSRTFARLASLGLLGRVYAQELADQIGRQSVLIRKRTLRLKMPRWATGLYALRARSLLALWRLAPGTLIRPIVRGALTTATIMIILAISGTSAAATWALILAIVVLIRPKELIAGFRQDIGQIFMSQMVTQDHATRWFAAALLPLVLMIAGGLMVYVLYPTRDLITGGIIVVLAFVGLGMAQAYEIVEDAVFIFRRVPYEYTVLVCGGLTVLITALTRSAIAAVIVLTIVDAIVASLLASARE